MTCFNFLGYIFRTMGDFFGYLAIILSFLGITFLFGYLTYKSRSVWLEGLCYIITTFTGVFTFVAIIIAFTGDFFYKESIKATALKNFKIVSVNDLIVVSSEKLTKTFDTIKWSRATPEDVTLTLGYNILGLNETVKYVLRGDE